MWLQLKARILNACTLCIPKVKLRAYQPPKWFTSEIRHRLNCIHSLRRRAKKHSTTYLSAKLISEERELENLMIRSKIEYEAKLLNDKPYCSKRVYRYLHSVSKHSCIPQSVFLGDITAHTPTEKAHLFNQYFHSIYQSYNHDTLANFDFHCTLSSSSLLQEFLCDEHEVFNILTSLDTSKATGVDSIGPKILKSCAISLYTPITLLFKKSLQSSHIPSEWKIHIITPIPKAGDPTNISNYRPIALLCSVSKVLETIVYDQIYKYALPFLSPNQSGFIKNRSCL